MLGRHRKRMRSIKLVKGFCVAFKWKESKLGTLSCGKAKMKILKQNILGLDSYFWKRASYIIQQKGGFERFQQEKCKVEALTRN